MKILFNYFLPSPFDEVWQVIEQAEGVEGVADNLCDSPGCDKQQYTVLTLNLRTHRKRRMMEGEQANSRPCIMLQ